MSNYEQSGNRYTAIFLREADGTYRRLPFDLVRFNVDDHPDQKREIVPRGDDEGKVFEKVWLVDQVPYAKKVSFSGLS